MAHTFIHSKKKKKKSIIGVAAVTQRVKDPALFLQQLGLLQRYRLDPSPALWVRDLAVTVAVA